METTGSVKDQNQLAGISWMIFRCFIVSLVIIIAKLLALKGYQSVQIVFFYSFIAFLFMLPFAIKKYGINSFYKTKILHLHLARSSLGVISMVMYFYSLEYVNLNDARAVALLEPVLTFIFGIVFLKEVVNNKKTLALIASLIGGLVIVNPTSPTFHPALFLIFGAMFMWSTIDIIMKKITKEESAVKQLLLFTLLMSLFSFVPATYYWKMPTNQDEFSLLILMGLLFCINSISIFIAMKKADLTTIIPFDFSGMIFTAILTYLFFNEIISLNTLIGSIIVFLSSLYLLFHEGKAARRLRKISEENVLKE